MRRRRRPRRRAAPEAPRRCPRHRRHRPTPRWRHRSDDPLATSAPTSSTKSTSTAEVSPPPASSASMTSSPARPGWQLATAGPQAVTGEHGDGAVTLQGRSQLTGQLTGVTTGSVNGRGREHSHVDRRASHPDGVTDLARLGLRQRPLSGGVDVHRITAQRGGHIVDRRSPNDCRPGGSGEQREDGNDEAAPHEATLSVAGRGTPPPTGCHAAVKIQHTDPYSPARPIQRHRCNAERSDCQALVAAPGLTLGHSRRSPGRQRGANPRLQGRSHYPRPFLEINC